MNLPTIAMEKGAARSKAEAIEAMRPSRRTEDDEATAKAYRAIEAGAALIDLYEVMRDAGLDDDARPRLAIARADAASVRFSRKREGAGTFYTGAMETGDRHRAMNVQLPPGTWQHPKSMYLWDGANRCAYTPTIPPEHRPPPSRMREHHVLWEAIWEPAPPGDPFLLRHLAGTLYIVLAQWDLTEIEKAVMRGRIQEAIR